MMNHYAMETLLQHEQHTIENRSRQAWRWAELNQPNRRSFRKVLKQRLSPILSGTLPTRQPSQASVCCSACC
ncbi:hypothetical protein COLU111180_09095 [Cohnella lubricantis]|nr:hypothetical protein [Cohnella lubricantis]